MAERSIIVTADIGVARSQLWDIVAATRRYSEWVQNTLEVTRVDSEVADPGVTYDERNRIIGPFTARSRWRVQEVQAQERTVHTGEGIALARWMRLELRLEELAPRRTRYTHHFSYEPALGPLGPLLNVVLEPSLRRDMRRTVARLKALAEASSA